MNFLIPFLSSRGSQRFVTQSVIIYLFIFLVTVVIFFLSNISSSISGFFVFHGVLREGDVLLLLHQVELLA